MIAHIVLPVAAVEGYGVGADQVHRAKTAPITIYEALLQVMAMNDANHAQALVECLNSAGLHSKAALNGHRRTVPP